MLSPEGLRKAREHGADRVAQTNRQVPVSGQCLGGCDHVPSTVKGYRIGVSSAGIETDADIVGYAANGSSPVQARLDSDARFALPLRAPAPEGLLLGMHLPHPRAGPGYHNRQAGEDPPPADSVRH